MALTESSLATWVASSTTSRTNTVTSGSFTPTANSLVVVITGCGNEAGVTVTGITVSDSVSGTWTQLVHLTGGGQFADASVWVKDAGASPSSQTVTVTMAPSGVLDVGVAVRQFTGAAPAASQNGVTNTSTGAATVSITPGTTGSQVVGAFGNAQTANRTANGSTTIYGQTSDSGGAGEGAFEATSLSTASTPITLGYTSAAGGDGLAVAEILPGGSPAVTTAATAAASFGATGPVSVSLVGSVGVGSRTTSGTTLTAVYGQSPTSGNLLVAAVVHGGTTAATWSSSQHTGTSGWTEATSPGAVGNNAAGTSSAGVDFWTKTASGGDAAPVFDVTISGTEAGIVLIYELANANTSSPVDTSGVYQSGGTAATIASHTAVTSSNVSLNGSFGIATTCIERGTAASRTYSNGGGSWVNDYSGDTGTSTSVHLAADHIANVSSGSTLTATYGWQSRNSSLEGAGVIVIRPLKTYNPTLAPSATAAGTFGGTKTAFRTLTSAVTAKAVFGGYSPQRFTSQPGQITVGLAVPGNTGETIASASTFNRSFTASVTAHAAFGGTKTAFRTVTPAATAQAVFSGTRTQFRSLTATATAAATFTRSRTTFGTLAAVATAAAATFTRTRTAFRAFTAGATAQVSLSGVHPGHLTTTATASAAFTRTRTTFGTISPAVTAHAVFAGTKTAFPAISTATTAQATFTRTRTAFRALTSTVTAQASFSAVHPGHLTTTVTAQAAFTRTRTTFGNFTAAITARLAATAHGPAVVRPPRNLGGTPVVAVLSGTCSETPNALGGTGTRVNYGGGSTAVVLSGTCSETPNSLAATATQIDYGGTNTQVPKGGGVTVKTLAGTNSETPNNLNATAVQIDYGGTSTQVNYGGANTAHTLSGTTSETPNALGGTISEVSPDGTITLADLGGGAVGWTMQNVNLNFAEFNDITLSVAITSNGSALNLTGYTVNMLLKPSAGILDSDGSVIKLSSGGGSPAITITSPSGGLCTVAITHADLQNQTLSFYRIDAVDASGNINTAIYGNIAYTAL